MHLADSNDITNKAKKNEKNEEERIGILRIGIVFFFLFFFLLSLVFLSVYLHKQTKILLMWLNRSHVRIHAFAEEIQNR